MNTTNCFIYENGKEIDFSKETNLNKSPYALIHSNTPLSESEALAISGLTSAIIETRKTYDCSIGSSDQPEYYAYYVYVNKEVKCVA